jgi:predicted naringenin-chalcone synthase
VLVTAGENSKGFRIGHFFSSINLRGKKDMAWQLSSKGFVMNLSSYIPDIIEEDFNTLVSDALKQAGITKEDINHWCIHPGGKKILESVHNSLGFSNGQLENSYDVLKNYGNMSSASVLFVLERIMKQDKNGNLFMAAFGPGLTMETALLSC